MTYNKTTWVNGDIITAEKLNNIENGIENSLQKDPRFYDMPLTQLAFTATITNGEPKFFTIGETPTELSNTQVVNIVKEAVDYGKICYFTSDHGVYYFSGMTGNSPYFISRQIASGVLKFNTLTFQQGGFIIHSIYSITLLS